MIHSLETVLVVVLFLAALAVLAKESDHEQGFDNQTIILVKAKYLDDSLNRGITPGALIIQEYPFEECGNRIIVTRKRIVRGMPQLVRIC